MRNRRLLWDMNSYFVIWEWILFSACLCRAIHPIMMWNTTSNFPFGSHFGKWYWVVWVQMISYSSELPGNCGLQLRNVCSCQKKSYRPTVCSVMSILSDPGNRMPCTFKYWPDLRLNEITFLGFSVKLNMCYTNLMYCTKKSKFSRVRKSQR